VLPVVHAGAGADVDSQGPQPCFCGEDRFEQAENGQQARGRVPDRRAELLGVDQPERGEVTVGKAEHGGP
jgi:hypothetical protein